MRVTQATQTLAEIVEVEGEEYPTYRRSSAGDWEVLMGESWEPVFFCEELEAAYRLFRSQQ